MNVSSSTLGRQLTGFGWFGLGRSLEFANQSHVFDKDRNRNRNNPDASTTGEQLGNACNRNSCDGPGCTNRFIRLMKWLLRKKALPAYLRPVATGVGAGTICLAVRSQFNAASTWRIQSPERMKLMTMKTVADGHYRIRKAGANSDIANAVSNGKKCHYVQIGVELFDFENLEEAKKFVEGKGLIADSQSLDFGTDQTKPHDEIVKECEDDKPV